MKTDEPASNGNIDAKMKGVVAITKAHFNSSFALKYGLIIMIVSVIGIVLLTMFPLCYLVFNAGDVILDYQIAYYDYHLRKVSGAEEAPIYLDDINGDVWGKFYRDIVKYAILAWLLTFVLGVMLVLVGILNRKNIISEKILNMSIAGIGIFLLSPSILALSFPIRFFEGILLVGYNSADKPGHAYMGPNLNLLFVYFLGFALLIIVAYITSIAEWNILSGAKPTWRIREIVMVNTKNIRENVPLLSLGITIFVGILFFMLSP